jgi:hypothetical protein
MSQWSEAKEKGAEAFKSNNIPEAVTWFGKAIDSDPKNESSQLHVFYSNRAAAYQRYAPRCC